MISSQFTSYDVFSGSYVSSVKCQKIYAAPGNTAKLVAVARKENAAAKIALAPGRSR
jgi:hypothetical protein